MASRRWELLDYLTGLCSRIASDAPDKYPDFMLAIGANMDNDFARIEELLIELKTVVKTDLVLLEKIADMIAKAKDYYYSGKIEQGEDILWDIYNDQSVMKMK